MVSRSVQAGVIVASAVAVIAIAACFSSEGRDVVVTVRAEPSDEPAGDSNLPDRQTPLDAPGSNDANDASADGQPEADVDGSPVDDAAVDAGTADASDADG